MKIGVALNDSSGLYEVQEIDLLGFGKPLPGGVRFTATTLERAESLVKVAAEQIDALGYSVKI